jgi:hypothetical protein
VSESGRIVNVTSEPLGSALAADVLSGDATVTVDDANDFDELEGGTLSLGGVQYAYTAVDNDTGILTLAGTLSAGASAGDRVDVWDTALAAPGRDVTAFVELPGFQANDDAVPASVRHSLIPLLAEGIRAPGTGETVKLERDGDSYEVIDVTGKQATIQPDFLPSAGGPVGMVFYSDLTTYTSTSFWLDPSSLTDSLGDTSAFSYDSSDPGIAITEFDAWYVVQAGITPQGTLTDVVTLQLNLPGIPGPGTVSVHQPAGSPTSAHLTASSAPFFISSGHGSSHDIDAQVFNPGGATIAGGYIYIVKLT